MRMTPRQLDAWMRGRNVAFAVNARMHGVKVDIPREGDGGQVDVDALKRRREADRRDTAKRARELGLPER